jgi:hypothetical protein
MARDLCFREDCWITRDIKYEPTDTMKLMAYPTNLCVREVSCKEDKGWCCETTKEAHDVINYYRFLKEAGFSLLLLGPGICQSYYASRAGWTKDQIVLLATGKDLHDLAIAERNWNNIWMEKNPGGPPPPPFHNVFYDEPQNVPGGATPILSWDLQDLNNWNPDIQIPKIPDNLYESDFLRKFCSCDFYANPNCEYNLQFHYQQKSRFYLMSLYIHECLGTTFTIGNYNSGWNNWWKDIVEFPKPLYPPIGSKGRNWIDSIIYTGYGDDAVSEWDEITNSGYGGNKAFISLQKNFAAIPQRLAAARNRNMKELWIFMQANEFPTWTKCWQELEVINSFRDQAVKAGLIRKIEGPPFRKCILIEIPGCRDRYNRGTNAIKHSYSFDPWYRGIDI